MVAWVRENEGLVPVFGDKLTFDLKRKLVIVQTIIGEKTTEVKLIELTKLEEIENE